MEKNSFWYRAAEMIPGVIGWNLILFPVWGSVVMPTWVAYFVIGFLVFWLYQSVKGATLSLLGYFKIKANQKIDWEQRVAKLGIGDREMGHVVIVCSYREPVEIVEMAIGSLAAQAKNERRRMWVVLALEERAGKENNQATIDYFSSRYKDSFADLLFTVHPGGLEGETAGKHSNEAWAAKWFKTQYASKKKMTIDKLTLTTCDVDTIFNPRFFTALSWYFWTRSRDEIFWQTPIFWHHNIEKVPSLIRIVGIIGNAMHLSTIQEPDGLFFNYSCYSAPYKLIDKAGYWDLDMIPEDWHIFLQTFFTSGGKTKVVPIFLPTIVDAPTGKNWWDAVRNRYNQSVRHAWGAVDIAYAISMAKKYTDIPIVTRLLRIYKLIETHMIWSSNWFILTLGTSLPIILNPDFFLTSVGFNLQRISNVILTICLIPLAVLIWVDWNLRPKGESRNWKRLVVNLLQWPLMPVATLTMSVLPGLHSHTRLMIGKRLEYKTTKKG